MALAEELRPRPEDELLHEPVGDESLPWKDTWYLSGLDPVSGAHLAMHMTVSANRSPDTRLAVGVRHGAHEHVVVRREDGAAGDRSIGNSLARIEPVNLSWDTAHELRWVCDGPGFEFDVTVKGTHVAPFFNTMFPGVYPTGELGHSYSHTEQIVRIDGNLAFDGEGSVAVAATGWRDRGWGRRKNDVTFGFGYDLIGGVLPDGSSFAFTGMGNIEHDEGAPLPLYGFWADADDAVPCIGGDFFKDSASFPAHLDLEFAGGRRVAAEQVRHLSTLGTPFHDAEPEEMGIAVHARDFYALLRNPEGHEFPVFSNQGVTARANVTRGGRFFGAETPTS